MVAEQTWQQIFTALRQENVPFLVRERMAQHTTFAIGGEATCFVLPEREDQLICALNLAKEHGVPLFVLGRGSNLLVDDRGFDGMVIATTKLRRLSLSGNATDATWQIEAQCGASLRELAVLAQQNALRGAACLHGIPGSIGGAIRMNAGAFGGEIGSLVAYVRCYDRMNDKVVRIAGADFQFGTRSSLLSAHPELVCLSATLRFDAPPVELMAREQIRAELRESMEEYKRRRRATQPLNYPSAGSVFKRPVGHFAGKLIEDCQLKGTTHGGAQISPKHAGFIVNLGGATAEDVCALIELAKRNVKEQFDVALEEEIILLRNEQKKC